MLIYKITNKLNGKCYIGQTKRKLEVRIRQHLREDSHCHALKNAFKKYGIENFDVEVLEECDDLAVLNLLEKHYISLHNSLSPTGYNLIFGDEKTVVSQETREKLRISSTGRVFSKISKDKISKALKGNKNSSGRTMSEQNKAKLLLSKAKITEETAKDIKLMIANGKPNREIVESLGVSVYTVKDIRRGRTWKHV